MNLEGGKLFLLLAKKTSKTTTTEGDNLNPSNTMFRQKKIELFVCYALLRFLFSPHCFFFSRFFAQLLCSFSVPRNEVPLQFSFFPFPWKNFSWYCGFMPFFSNSVRGKKPLYSIGLWFKIAKTLQKNGCFEWNIHCTANKQNRTKPTDFPNRYFHLILSINWDNWSLIATTTTPPKQNRNQRIVSCAVAVAIVATLEN